jgi:hypothetical protein
MLAGQARDKKKWLEHDDEISDAIGGETVLTAERLSAP